MSKLKRAYAKGRKGELEYQRYLEDQGYKVISAPKGNRFTKQKDLFGAWELIAYKPLTDKILFIQCKTNSTGGVKKKLQEYFKSVKKLDFTRIFKGELSIINVLEENSEDISLFWEIFDIIDFINRRNLLV